jgi:hypothetical protein
MITLLEATQNLLEQHHSGIGVFTKGEINESEKLKGVRLADDSKLSFTFDDVLTKQTELKAEYDAQAYSRNRQTEYPSTGDQLDYIFHNGVAKWKTDMIEPVKAKWPKDNSGPVL